MITHTWQQKRLFGIIANMGAYVQAGTSARTHTVIFVTVWMSIFFCFSEKGISSVFSRFVCYRSRFSWLWCRSYFIIEFSDMIWVEYCNSRWLAWSEKSPYIRKKFKIFFENYKGFLLPLQRTRYYILYLSETSNCHSKERVVNFDGKHGLTMEWCSNRFRNHETEQVNCWLTLIRQIMEKRYEYALILRKTMWTSNTVNEGIVVYWMVHKVLAYADDLDVITYRNESQIYNWIHGLGWRIRQWQRLWD